MSDPADDLKIDVATRDSGEVVRVRGEVDLHTSPQLRRLLLETIEKQPERLIVDLSSVSYMDSSGVGTMVESKRLLERTGGRMVLVGLQPRVQSVFEITQLDRFFEFAADLDEAGRR